MADEDESKKTKKGKGKKPSKEGKKPKDSKKGKKSKGKGIPDDVAKELDRLAKQAKMDKKEVGQEYKEIYQSGYLQKYEGMERHKWALMTLQSRLLSRITSDAETYIGQVIDYTNVRKVKGGNLVGNVYMMVIKEPEDDDEDEDEEVEFQLAHITLWREMTGCIPTLEREKWYKVSLREGNEEDGILALSSDDTTTFREIDALEGAPPLSNFIDDLFPRVPLAEFEEHLSKGENGDWHMAYGNVIRRIDAVKAETGRHWGRMDLSDDSLDIEKAGAGDKTQQAVTVFCGGVQAIYAKDSIIQAIGRFEIDEENGDRRIQAEFINAIVPVSVVEVTQQNGHSGGGKEVEEPANLQERDVALDDI
jgi:hypothetical protein